jgi:aspartate aminotransferase-like enzyme
MTDAFIKRYLMTAGPTPLPPQVSQVMAEPILYHRAPAFIEVYARCLERLPRVFETRNDVLCFASSGSGAMESAVANLTRPGEPAVVASCGKFGERWAELCNAYGADTRHLDVEWGRRVEPAELDRVLGESDGRGGTGGARIVFTTLSETSTGVVNDVRALADVAHRHDALIVVDAVSGVGAVPVKQDEWELDVVVGGSQKALMSPPGLGFASASSAALDRAAAGGPGRYYFDWQRTAAGQRKDPPDSPFTPAVGLFMALDVALGMIEEEGLAEVHARHRLLGDAAREAARALELELFGPEDENANVVTAIRLPAGIDGAKVPKLMRERFGVTVAGGQGRLAGQIVRIAHCGYFGAFDIVASVAALEMTLRELGHEVELGAGVGAAQQVFSGAGVPVGTPA